MEAGIFPDQHQVADWLAKRRLGHHMEVLLPGDSWDVETRPKVQDAEWDDFSFEDRWPYLEGYAERRRTQLEAALSKYPEPDGSLWEPFREYFLGLLAMSPHFNERIYMRVGFGITGPGGGRWSVDFRPGFEGVSKGTDDCQYMYRYSSRWLAPLIEQRVPWEDFFLSLRFEAWRDPDLYNDHLLGLLKFAEPEALAAVESFDTALASDERMTIHSEGKVYSVSRYCPHAGNDLLNTGEVLPGGILRCLAHHYEFDLDTGSCITGVCPPLEVELLGDADEEAALEGSISGLSQD